MRGIRGIRATTAITVITAVLLGLHSVAHADVGPALVVGPGLIQKVFTRALQKYTSGTDPSRVQFGLESYSTDLPGVDLSTAPEIVRVYGQNLFGFDLFNEPVTLRSSLKDLNIELTPSLEALEFKPATSGVRIDLVMALQGLTVAIGSVRVTEPRTTLWVLGKNVRLAPVKPLSPIHVRIALEVSVVDSALKIRVIKSSSDIATVMPAHFKLSVKDTEFTRIGFKSEGEFFPADTTELRKFLVEVIPSLNGKIAQALDTMLKTRLGPSLQALMDETSIPTEYSLTVRDCDPLRPELLRRPYLHPQDGTRVAKSPRQEMAEAKARAEEPPVSAWAPLLNRVSFLKYDVKVVGFSQSEDRTHLGVHLADRLSLERGTAFSDGLDYRAEPPRIEEGADMGVVVPEVYLNEKLALPQIYRTLESAYLPRGVSFDRAAPLKISADGPRLKATGRIEVNLAKMNGILPKVAALWEKAAGDTGGILKFELPIEIEPEFLADRIQLHLSLGNGFGSNIGDSAGIYQFLYVKLEIKKLIEKKIREFPLSIPTGELIEKAGVQIIGLTEPEHRKIGLWFKYVGSSQAEATEDRENKVECP